MESYVNLKKVGKNVLLAICDCEMLGRTLREGKIVFHVKDEFYKGGKVSVEEAMSMIENSTIVCDIENIRPLFAPCFVPCEIVAKNKGPGASAPEAVKITIVATKSSICIKPMKQLFF